MIIFDSEQEKVKLNEVSELDEIHGKLDKDDSEDKLMRSIIENDRDEIEQGKIIAESINQGIGNFNSDLIFRNVVNNYQMAKKLYGETLIRKLSGYNPNYVKKNLNIPEFQTSLKENIEKNIKKLKEKNLIDKEGNITKQALKFSSRILYMEELDKLILKGFGEKREKKKDVYGEKSNLKNYSKSSYKNLAIKQSVKTAIRRGHESLLLEDLRIHERTKKGKVSIIYALDSSGSMKGDKLGMGKKAGIALAFKAINEKNNVGLIIFGSEIIKAVEPCQNFELLLEELANIKASRETDIAKTIKKSIEMFPKSKITKHLILITDALPTKGDDPVKKTLEAVSFARNSNITISVLGINLDKAGLELAKKIVEIGDGRLYRVKNLENMDLLVLEDYYSI